MKTSIILPPHEAINLGKVEKVKPFWFMRPLEKQPPEGWAREGEIETSSLGEAYCFFIDPNAEVGQVPKTGQTFFTSYHLQYPVGAKLDVKGTEDHLLIVSDEVKRVQELCNVDRIRLIGTFGLTPHELHCVVGHDLILDKFIKHFNSLYAKPRKKGDGFVCYSCDMDSWFKIYRYNKNYKYSDIHDISYWKGKPLTICYNPYIEFVEAKVV